MRHKLLTFPAAENPALRRFINDLENQHLADDGSLVLKNTASDLKESREALCTARSRYLETLAWYEEVVHLARGGSWDSTMVAESASASPSRIPGLGREVETSLQRRLAVAEASQHHQLNVPEGSADLIATGEGLAGSVHDALGMSPGCLKKSQVETSTGLLDKYVEAVVQNVSDSLTAKCERVAAVFSNLDDGGPRLFADQARELPKRLSAALEDLRHAEIDVMEEEFQHSRKFAEYFKVLNQLLATLLMFVKDFRLGRQLEQDRNTIEFLLARLGTLELKLRVLHTHILKDTYSSEAVSALNTIKSYLDAAVDDARLKYDTMVVRLRQYQGVDSTFDEIAVEFKQLCTLIDQTERTIEDLQQDMLPNVRADEDAFIPNSTG